MQIFAIKRKLRSFLRLVIKRRVPHTMVSWRFLLPDASKAVRLHRAVFLRSWRKQPLALRLFILVYSLCLWFTWYGWRQMVTAWRRYAIPTKDRFRISLSSQAVSLFNLTFLNGIPPHFYYRYGLFRTPRKRWFHYVYDHELPHWHTVMCGKHDVSRAALLLGDKKRFAEVMAEAAIATVETRDFIQRGDPVSAEMLFAEQSLFCKPNSANRSQGAFELRYAPQDGQYRLTGEETVSGKEAILRYFSKITSTQDYILQPLLINHPEIHEMCGLSRLATIRVVTAHSGHKVICVGAVFEMPRPENQNLWWVMPLDIQTGTITKPIDTVLRPRQKDNATPPDIAGRKLPNWDDVLQLCFRAHALFPEITAIGWDAAITPAGAVLIEGNFNWRAGVLQMLSGMPLLESEIADIYASRLWPENDSPIRSGNA
jgi:hypothetical protein